jgi:hypothetical protein
MENVTVKWYIFYVYILYLVHTCNEFTNAGIMLHVLFAQNAIDVSLFHLLYHLTKKPYWVSTLKIVSGIALESNEIPSLCED